MATEQEASTVAGAQFTVDDFVDVRWSEMPTYSPDGSRITYRANHSGVMQAYVVDANGGEPTRLTQTDGVIYGVRYRPRHDEVNFTADVGGDEQYQQHLVTDTAGASRAMIAESEVINEFGSWSEDGKRFSYASNARDQRFFDLFIVDVDAGDHRLVYEQDGMNHAGAMSADGGSMLFTRPNLDQSGDINLYLLDLDSGAERSLSDHEGAAVFTAAEFHASGAVLALSNDDREYMALLRIDIESGEREYLITPDWDIEFMSLSPDGQRVLTVVNVDGYSEAHIHSVTADGRIGDEVALPEIADGVISSPAWRPDGDAIAFTFEGAQLAPAIWTAELSTSTLRRVTGDSGEGTAFASIPTAELIHYTSFDGREIPAFYYRPPGASPDEPLPCFVLVHGGPESQSRPVLGARYAAPTYLLARGDVALLVPNVRGSTGYGKHYSHLDDVDLRMDSVRDLVAAVDWVAARADLDQDRVGVMGGSYGGFMTLAAITEAPERWAVAVDLFGIVNFQSFLQHTGPWRRRQRAAEYGDPDRDAELLHSISPIHKVDQIVTPLLVIQGDRDTRVPQEESDQMVEAIRHNEGIVEYVIFEDEGHGIAKLPHRREMAHKIVGFSEEHLLTSAAE
jgi:dipeptidyl aminopeptidase/acylaminoacyl peptidase